MAFISKKKSRRNYWLAWGIPGVLVFLLLILVAINLPQALAMVRSAEAGKANIQEAQRLLAEEQDFAHAAEQLGQAEAHMTEAYDRLQQVGSWRLIPVAGRQLRAVGDVLQAGTVLAKTIRELSLLIETIIVPITANTDESFAALTPQQKRQILEQLYGSTPKLAQIQSDMAAAVTFVNDIPESGLVGPVKEIVEPLKAQVPALQNAMKQFVLASEIVPQIAGYPTAKTYLFLLQNNTELRPTGGFIGTYGILQIADGEIATFRTDNIYNLDNPAKDRLFIEPPKPLQKYLQSTQWFLRDSNWSPDFPTAAQEALRFYELEGGSARPIHGVIAVTPTLIESLLVLTGPITVDGVEFTSANVVDVLEYQVEQGFYRQGISDADRKEVIGDLADELMKRLLEFPKDRWDELWSTVMTSLLEKHVLLYMKDPGLQELVVAEHWAGEVPSTDGDFLHIVDANMASLKSDPGVYRTVDYSVKPVGDDLEATVAIHYDNRGTFSWKATRYRTYTRVYVPEGSELLEHSGVMDNDKLHGGRPGTPEVANELGKTVIGGFISIEPQTQGQLVYRYRLPRPLTETIKSTGQYELLLLKQSGTPNRTVKLDLDMPWKPGSVEPLDNLTNRRDTTVLMETNLRQDRTILITRD